MTDRMTLDDIEAITDEYARAREALKTELDRGEAECEAVRRRYLPRLKPLAGRVRALRAELDAALRDHPRLFVKPRTRTFSAVRVGLTKRPGRIVAADEKATIGHIERYYPKDVPAAVKKTKKLVRKVLSSWTADKLKRCGVMVTDSVDAPMVKPVDGDLERTVAAWLEGADDG